MLELYMVSKKPMALKGGEVREVGQLVPEAVNFTAHTKTALMNTGLLTRVVVVNQKQFKQLQGALASKT